MQHSFISSTACRFNTAWHRMVRWDSIVVWKPMKLENSESGPPVDFFSFFCCTLSRTCKEKKEKEREREDETRDGCECLDSSRLTLEMRPQSQSRPYSASHSLKEKICMKSALVSFTHIVCPFSSVASPLADNSIMLILTNPARLVSDIRALLSPADSFAILCLPAAGGTSLNSAVVYSYMICSCRRFVRTASAALSCARLRLFICCLSFC